MSTTINVYMEKSFSVEGKNILSEAQVFASWVNLHAFFLLIYFPYYVSVSKKILHEFHQSVNQLGSRSGQTYCRALI